MVGWTGRKGALK